MQKYLVGRILGSIPILLAVSVLIFALIHLIPGDPAKTMLGLTASEEQLEATRAQLGLDQPLPVQYLRFLGNALRGDFGRSIVSRKPVSHEIGSRVGATVELALTAAAIATILGVATGIISALRRGTWIDLLSSGVAILGISLPVYWLGLMLMLLFAVQFQLLPSAGREGPEYLVLPAITLGVYSTAVISRMTRASMLEALSYDYVRTARAKGLSERMIIYRHVLRNAMIPIITVIGLQLGTLLSGAVITESVFAWPGIGKLAVDAIKQRDYPLVQALVLFMAVLFIAVNLIVDILYGFFDPRIRYE
ncbi:MAG: ABC transporter permease [Anaerolineae bacterium]|jgi:peptide/nickel transport system permease protein